MSVNEKAARPVLPTPASTEPTRPKPRSYRWVKVVLLFCAAYNLARYALVPGTAYLSGYAPVLRSEKSKTTCAQADPLMPSGLDPSAVVEGHDDRIIAWLADAVKIPTEIFDVMGPVGEDARWEVFYKFADYLEQAFPLVHAHLTRSRVATHALLFEWEGSDPSLKPLLLTGHQDVVPVLPATRDLWTHDPYGGEYDPETRIIWGRGSSDDKSGTIGVLSGVELLLQSGFKPTRTVILAFGTDEETGGKVGAYHLGLAIEEKYGKDSIAMLVDEGNGLQDLWGQTYGVPAVAEKGYLDVEVRVETKGGHSSVPPPHTGIGLLARLITALEDNPNPVVLPADGILVEMLTCAAETAPDFPKKAAKQLRALRKSTASGKTDKKTLEAVREWILTDPVQNAENKHLGRAIMSTTQAVDIVNGGVKINALPEVVTAVVNHRIDINSSPKELQHHIIKTLSPVASKYGLSMEAFGEDVDYDMCPMMAGAGKIILSEAFNSSLLPAPISPYTVDKPAWRLLAGTSRGVYASRPESRRDEDESEDLLMVPFYAIGNTDTKRYWQLTQNIYRFGYLSGKGGANAHTVDEHISADAFIELVRWFVAFIANVDENRDI